MKKILSLVVLGILCGMMWVNLAYADLTKQDIEEIRKIVKEEVNDLRQEMNIRIDDVNKRIDDMRHIILSGFAVLFAGMFALISFVLWDRRTALAPAVKKAKELEEREEKMEKALKKYAIQQPKLAAILKEVGIL
ncbi:MAG: hypothetical protein AB1567_11095 [bacterium]